MALDGWREVRLGDLVSIKHGWPFKSQYFSDSLTGLPIVINVGNFRYTGGFRFDSTTTREYRNEYPKEYELLPGEILLVMTCQTPGGEILGIPARVPDDQRIYLHNQRLGRVVIRKPELVREDFLYYLFLWSDFNSDLYLTSSGTKILHTAPSRIESFEFSLPALAEQQAIAHVLGALDDKIELNRRMNETLEAMARAIFKSWFVDFDPVVAKSEGRQPYGMNAETAALFPDSFQDSPLGPIPKGWQIGAIADIARYVNGRNFTKNATGTGRLVIRIAELNSGPGASTKYNEVRAEPENIAYPDDILFSWSGSLDVYRWYREEALINQHIFKVICHEFPKWFVYRALEDAMPFFQGIAAGKATTMGHIKKGHLAEARLALPSKSLLEAASDTLDPLWNSVYRNHAESQTLSVLRDTLLPKLLSGQLPVKAAHQFRANI